MHGLMRGRWKRSNGRGDSGTRRRKGEKQTEPLPTATAPVLYSTQVRIVLALFGALACPDVVSRGRKQTEPLPGAEAEALVATKTRLAVC